MNHVNEVFSQEASDHPFTFWFFYLYILTKFSTCRYWEFGIDYELFPPSQPDLQLWKFLKTNKIFQAKFFGNFVKGFYNLILSYSKPWIVICYFCNKFSILFFLDWIYRSLLSAAVKVQFNDRPRDICRILQYLHYIVTSYSVWW